LITSIKWLSAAADAYDDDRVAARNAQEHIEAAGNGSWPPQFALMGRMRLRIANEGYRQKIN